MQHHVNAQRLVLQYHRLYALVLMVSALLPLKDTDATTRPS